MLASNVKFLRWFLLYYFIAAICHTCAAVSNHVANSQLFHCNLKCSNHSATATVLNLLNFGYDFAAVILLARDMHFFSVKNQVGGWFAYKKELILGQFEIQVYLFPSVKNLSIIIWFYELRRPSRIQTHTFNSL